MKSVLTTRITVTFSLILMCFVVLSPQVEAQTIVSVDDYVQTVKLPNITTFIVDDVTLTELESSKMVPDKVAPNNSQRGFGSMSQLKSLLSSNQLFSSFISNTPSYQNQQVTQEINNNDLDPIIESVEGVFVVHDNDKAEIQNYLIQLRKMQPKAQVYPLYLYNATEDGRLNPVVDQNPSSNPTNTTYVIDSSAFKIPTRTLPVDIVEEITVEKDQTQIYDFENTLADISNLSILKPSADVVEESNPVQESINTVGNDINPAAISTLRQ